MKPIFITAIFFLSIFFGGCTPETPATSVGTNVEYQFTASNPNIVFIINQNDKDGNSIGGAYSTGWRASFTPANLPFTASLRVFDDNQPFSNVTVTLKILSNGIVVKESTSTLTTNNRALQIQATIN